MPDSLIVSVILTVYRRTEFLREAIESALAQTLSAGEIIVTDDSASAEIRDICESFAGTTVRYRANPQRLGVVENMRAAVAEARGELVAILNDDDVWEPEFLSSLVPPLAEKSERALAFSDHWLIDERGEIDAPATDANTARYARDILPPGEVRDTTTLVLEKNGVPLAMAAVFRKDAPDWQHVVPEVAGAYDFWLSCLLAATGRPFYYVNRRLTRYRVHGQRETARRAADKNENMAFIYRMLLAENSFPEKRAFLRRCLALTLRTCGRDRLRFGETAPARERFSESIAIHPTGKALAGWLLTWLPRARSGTQT
jgi:glycosyltransferase involved in cell wall biosynthesis